MEIQPQYQTPKVAVPQRKKSKIRVLLFILILAILCLLIFFINPEAFKNLFTTKPKPALTTTQKAPSQPSVPVTLEMDKSVLLKQFGKITFSTVATASPTTADQINKDVAALVPSDGSDATYQNLKYSDGKQGLQITFTLPAAKYQSYFESATNQAQSPPWSLINAQRGSLYAFLETANPTFNLRLEESLTGSIAVANIQTETLK